MHCIWYTVDYMQYILWSCFLPVKSQNSVVDPYDYEKQYMSHVLEYKDDRWINLGTTLSKWFLKLPQKLSISKSLIRFANWSTNKICFRSFISKSTVDSWRRTWIPHWRVWSIRVKIIIKFLHKIPIYAKCKIISTSLFSVFSWSYLFDEDTGDKQILQDTNLAYYKRPQMILVDHDFCQPK